METDEEGSPVGNLIALVTFILFILLIVWGRMNEQQEETLLAKGSDSACGIVTDYWLSADAQPYIDYEYQVNGRTYYDRTPGEFEECQKNRACIGKRFLVEYATDKPEVNRARLAQECP